MKEIIESDFGIRLRLAFQGAKNAEIARRLSVSSAAVTNYIEGRVPSAETLTLISSLTNCSIHWLLTGDGPMRINEKQSPNLIQEITSDTADEEEFAAMFYNYRDLTEEDKEELRGLMVYVDHEITRRKKRREKNPRTADPARMESTRSHKR